MALPHYTPPLPPPPSTLFLCTQLRSRQREPPSREGGRKEGAPTISLVPFSRLPCRPCQMLQLQLQQHRPNSNTTHSACLQEPHLPAGGINSSALFTASYKLVTFFFFFCQCHFWIWGQKQGLVPRVVSDRAGPGWCCEPLPAKTWLCTDFVPCWSLSGHGRKLLN